MKKRRVLALLLALSLAVGMNGVTVLAASPAMPELPIAMQEDNTQADGAAGLTEEQQPEETAEEDKTGGQNGQENTDHETKPEVTDGSGNSNQGEASGDQNTSGDQTQDGKSDQEDQPAGGDDGTNPDSADPDGSEGTDGIEKPDGSDSDESENLGDTDADDTENPDKTDVDESEHPEDNEAGESVSDNTIEADEEEKTDATEKSHQSTPVRMMTFTDEVGMVITYNANAEYNYTIDESGTLTGITNADGTSVKGEIVLAENKGIKRIAQGAFTGNTQIEYIKMPAGVTSIGENAFKGCTALKGMTIPNGVSTIETSAFEGCSSLRQFALPATIVSIGNRAFYGDDKLFMVYMRNNSISQMTSIGDYAFSGCSALVEFCSDVQFTFPDGLTSIGEYAFYNCESIKSIAFPNNITTMGAHVFEACSALTEVSLPDKLAVIPKYAFADCLALISVKFKDEENDTNRTDTIDSYAFKGCYKLNSIELSNWVEKVAAFAFIDCDGLRRVQIPQPKCVIEDDAFPDTEQLTLVAPKSSPAYDYTINRKIKFVSMDSDSSTSYFKYEIMITGISKEELDKLKEKNQYPIQVSTEKDPLNIKDPNNENNKQGVASGTALYVYTKNIQGIQGIQDRKLVAGSLKCNGTPIKYSGGYYSFDMPKGIAVITAEFELTEQSSEIVGTTVTPVTSNGENLKVGQTTRLFLLDAYNNVIPSSKITYKSEKPTIVKVDNNGLITALNKGSANVVATVTGGNGLPISTRVFINVDKTDATYIKLTAPSPDSRIFEISEKAVGDQNVQIASAKKISFSKNDVQLKLKAEVYDADDDGMSVPLTWVSSDARVAKLAKASTGNAESENVVTIPKGASGEATITVTATNADKKKITQKFIIQVMDYTPRLSSASLTLNLQKEEGVVLQLISSYDRAVDTDTVKLVYADNTAAQVTEFKKPEYDSAGSSGGVYRYIINPASPNIDLKTYNVKVEVNNDKDNLIPLKITVKSSIPNPKVSFDKKQQKINLFLANDEVEVLPKITNLGSEKIESYALESLESDKDKLFEENFEIDENTGIITRSNSAMKYDSKKKPVTTGYLVMRFEGYKYNNDTLIKRKITIPTQTVKPSYKLDRTSDTYRMQPTERTVVLSLLDTKNKKQQVVLDDADWTVELLEGSARCVTKENVSINSEGRIEMILNANLGNGGKIKLGVRNNEWAEGQQLSFTYTVKATTASPKIKLKTATVNLNSNYTEQVAEFSLVSNQSSTVLADEQEEFMPVSPGKKQAEYDKLSIEYSGNTGRVWITDPTIAKGTYKFKINHVKGIGFNGNAEEYNAVTLSVKVTNAVPSMTVKGTAALNLAAVKDDSYIETAELKLNVKLPEGYEVEPEGTIGTIACTTKGKAGAEEQFNWEIQDNVLKVSLNDSISAATQTYSFSMTPVYSSSNGGGAVNGKKISFKVKVYTGVISMKLSAKGVLNLLDRGDEDKECTLKNSIMYTPTFKNLKDQITEVHIFDAGGVQPELGDDESEYFDAVVLNGKIYVTPKPGAEIENKKTYPVSIWVGLEGYGGDYNSGGMWAENIKIKTAQIIPKITTDKSSLNLYLSRKTYADTFTVKPKEGSVGKISEVVFGEKDTKSEDTFELICVPQDDGSLRVEVKLKDTVSYAGGTTSKVTMYVQFEGQGVNTTGTPITMNIKINK